MATIPYLYRKLRGYGVPHAQAILMSDPSEDALDSGLDTIIDEKLEDLGVLSNEEVSEITGTLNTHGEAIDDLETQVDTNVGAIDDLNTALALKAPKASPTFTGTVAGVTKSHVGLGSVDNTTDSDKPISTATQTALDLKAPLASPTFTGTVAGVTKTHVGLGSVDNTSDASKPVSTATQTALDLKAPIASPTFTGTVSGVTKAMVGLSAVANVKIVTWAVGSEPSFSGEADGTIWIGYTP